MADQLCDRCLEETKGGVKVEVPTGDRILCSKCSYTLLEWIDSNEPPWVTTAIGFCPECDDLVIMKEGGQGFRYVGCAGDDCEFAMPVPQGKGTVEVADRGCDRHDMSRLKIVYQRKGDWEFGCPICNYEQWEMKEPSRAKNSFMKAKRLQIGGWGSEKFEKSLTTVRGVGETTVDMLMAEGIRTIEGFLDADPERVSEILESQERSRFGQVTVEEVERWQHELTPPPTAKEPASE